MQCHTQFEVCVTYSCRVSGYMQNFSPIEREVFEIRKRGVHVQRHPKLEVCVSSNYGVPDHIPILNSIGPAVLEILPDHLQNSPHAPRASPPRRHPIRGAGSVFKLEGQGQARIPWHATTYNSWSTKNSSSTCYQGRRHVLMSTAYTQGRIQPLRL